MPQEHELKCLTEYFLQVCAGRKNFELRKDDRGYRIGDKVVLLEWDPKNGYTGAKTRELTISYILRDKPEYGLAPGWCIFCWE